MPDLDHDAHDGTLQQADTWLTTEVPQLMADPHYQNGSTLIEIIFDEGKGSNQTTTTVLINPALTGQLLIGAYNHYSLLRLNQELLGLVPLGGAATANDMRAELGL